MDKPGDLFDRDTEWEQLGHFVQAEDATRVGIVYGRRRQGKSWLLRRVVAGAGGIYMMALQHDRRSALDRFAAALAEASDMDGVSFRLEDWEQALATARQVLVRNRQHLLVLDEYPYLLEHSPELPSVLQAFYDDSVNDPGVPGVAIVLCGSAIGVMEQVLSGQSPLRGRTRLEMRVQPFDFRTAAAFWELAEPRVAFHVDAILGGTPGYRALAGSAPPDHLDELPGWLAATVLNPASALFSESEYLLREDPRIQDRSVYFAVLAALARGHTSQTTLGGAIGRDRTSLAHPLDVLTTAGFVTRNADVRKARGASYRIADPIVRFHQLITRPRLSQFEEQRWKAAWDDAATTFRSQILGPHFEHLAREWTRRFADPTTTGGQVGEVGSTVLNDRARRSRHEVDVIGLPAGARSGKKTTPVLCVGEAKDSNRPRTLADLDRLERIRGLLDADGAHAAGAQLLLFGRSGFDRGLRRAAAGRPDVALIDIERLYHGS